MDCYADFRRPTFVHTWEPITKRGQTRLGLDKLGAVIEHRRPQLLQLKVQLRDVHPAVWRRFTLGDNLSIADLHRIIQVLMDWDDEHLHCFRIHGQDYGIEYTDGMPFDEDAETVPLSRFGFRPTERFLYEYDFTDGWEIEIRVENIIDEAVSEEKLIPRCIAGREPAPPDGSGGPRIYAEQRVDAVGPYLTEDMKTVGDVLVRLVDGDDTALADPETFFEFKQAVSRLKSREPLLAVAFPRAAINAALREAFTTRRGSP
jgi:hypothetical protein